MPTGGEGTRQDAIDAAVKEWRQGDCVVTEQHFVHRFAPNNPLTPESVEAKQEDGEGDLVESSIRGFAVLTQACDIVRVSADRPYIEVAPLVEVEADQMKPVIAGYQPQFAYVPALESQRLVVDLDRIMTVEKGVVSTWTRTQGCLTDEHRRAFADAIARKRLRHAFPDDFTEFANKLQKRVREKHDRQTDEGKGLRALLEIRVRAAPSWDADHIELTFWFIRKDDAPDFEGKNWADLCAQWLALVQAAGRFAPVGGVVVGLGDMTARDYVESDRLDLDHLSNER